MNEQTSDRLASDLEIGDELEYECTDVQRVDKEVYRVPHVMHEILRAEDPQSFDGGPRLTCGTASRARCLSLFRI